MKHDPHLANDLVVQSLVAQNARLTAQIAKLTERIEALEKIRPKVIRPRQRKGLLVSRSLTPQESAKASPILQWAATKFGTTVLEICGARGSARTISARSFAAYELRRVGFSSVVVGLVLGGRHHTTALHLIARHKRRMGIE